MTQADWVVLTAFCSIWFAACGYLTGRGVVKGLTLAIMITLAVSSIVISLFVVGLKNG